MPSPLQYCLELFQADQTREPGTPTLFSQLIKPQNSQGAEMVAINVSDHPSPTGAWMQRQGEVLRHQEEPRPPRVHLQKKVNH